MLADNSLATEMATMAFFCKREFLSDGLDFIMR